MCSDVGAVRLDVIVQTREHNGDVELSLSISPPEPFDVRRLFAFLSARAIHGVEVVQADSYLRTLRLSHGHGVLRLSRVGREVSCHLQVADARDLDVAVERCHWLLDLDTDLMEVDACLGAEPILAESVRRMPGLRVPGHVDGFELAVRAVVGQQISVAGARTIAGRLAAQYGERLTINAPAGVTRVFPEPEVLAGLDPDTLPMPRARGRCLVGVATAIADGTVRLDRSVDRAEVRASLVTLVGVGPWTADYIAMRALGDPDVFLATDLGVRHGLARLGVTGPAAAVAQRWRPWRSYAMMHIWAAATLDAGGTTKQGVRT